MFEHRKGHIKPTDSVNPRTYNRTREHTIERLFASGFPFSRKLSGHTSCVNALAFSSGDGQWLASGGDDLHIRLWNFHQENIEQPSCSFLGPTGNVFTLAFSATNQYLYSGGTDDKIIKYDISHPLRSPGSSLDNSGSYIVETFLHHTDSIRAISCHPFQDEVFLSGSEDGKIVLCDDRANGTGMTRAQGTLQLSAEVTGVQSHPHMEHIFATSDSHGCVCLRDSRMAFGPLTQRNQEGIVQQFHTKLATKSVNHLSNPETSSIVFDREGRNLAVTMLHYLPTIYSISDPWPLATCSGRNLPDGTPAVSPSQRTYSNSCTIKHGSFGGPGLDHDAYYAAGSDDFRGYVWNMPSISTLTDARKEISVADWAQQGWPNTIAFAEGRWKPRYVPVELSTPLFVLNGHNSIVNSTLIHPHLPHIVTSGVERHILLHSPTKTSPCCSDLSRTQPDVRRLPEANPEDHRRFLRALLGPLPTSDEEVEEAEDRDDLSTIALFDEILRHEGDSNVFVSRRWSPESDDQEDMELEDDSC